MININIITENDITDDYEPKRIYKCYKKGQTVTVASSVNLLLKKLNLPYQSQAWHKAVKYSIDKNRYTEGYLFKSLPCRSEEEYCLHLAEEVLNKIPVNMTIDAHVDKNGNVNVAFNKESPVNEIISIYKDGKLIGKFDRFSKASIFMGYEKAWLSRIIHKYCKHHLTDGTYEIVLFGYEGEDIFHIGDSLTFKD